MIFTINMRLLKAVFIFQTINDGVIAVRFMTIFGIFPFIAFKIRNIRLLRKKLN